MNSLSGRFLILTIIFVLIAEVLIFLPSIARFRQEFLMERLERAQLASLSLLADPVIDGVLEAELLENAGVLNVALRRSELRQLVLASPIPEPLSASYDMRDAGVFELIADALRRLSNTRDEVIRVIGVPAVEGGELIEVTLRTTQLRAEMIDYSLRILWLSLIISVVAASLLFVAVRFVMVRPIQGLVINMKDYADAPEDARRVIQPSSGILELREAQDSLKDLQTELAASLRQKEHLAQLGSAVAKISHDLRNILTSAQLFADRLEGLKDPLAERLVPKLLRSVQRAISLTEATLAYGRAEEPAPQLTKIQLYQLVEDLLANEEIFFASSDLSLCNDVPETFECQADAEQLQRVLGNLVRNAGQAIAAQGKPGEIRISAVWQNSAASIDVWDNGPGLPLKTRENLFVPFKGNVRKGGTGLGLTIASELVRGHGGTLTLIKSDDQGTVFRIELPQLPQVSRKKERIRAAEIGKP